MWGFGKQGSMVSFPPPERFTHTETRLPLLLPLLCRTNTPRSSSSKQFQWVLDRVLLFGGALSLPFLPQATLGKVKGPSRATSHFTTTLENNSHVYVSPVAEDFNHPSTTSDSTSIPHILPCQHHLTYLHHKLMAHNNF